MSLKITLQKNPLDQSSWMVKSPPAQWTVENGSELKLNGQSIIDLPNVINLPTPPKKNLNDYINGLSEVAADVMCTTITPDNIIKQLQTRIKQKQQNDVGDAGPTVQDSEGGAHIANTWWVQVANRPRAGIRDAGVAINAR